MDKNTTTAATDATQLQPPPPATATPVRTEPIALNEEQERAVKIWAVDRPAGMWATEVVREINLRIFARKILASLPAPVADDAGAEGAGESLAACGFSRCGLCGDWAVSSEDTAVRLAAAED